MKFRGTSPLAGSAYILGIRAMTKVGSEELRNSGSIMTQTCTSLHNRCNAPMGELNHKEVRSRTSMLGVWEHVFLGTMRGNAEISIGDTHRLYQQRPT